MRDEAPAQGGSAGRDNPRGPADAADLKADLREAFHRARKSKWNGSRDGFDCCCPCHDDKHPSCSVNIGDIGLVAHCHADRGCKGPDILEALGVPIRNRKRPPRDPGASKVEKRWDYTSNHPDEPQTVTMVRKDWLPKKQRMRFHPRGVTLRPGEKWLPLHPFKPDGPLAPTGNVMVIVEGEKTADAIVAAGYQATTAKGGAGNAHQTDWGALFETEAVLILWPDNDAPGREHMADIRRLAQAAGRETRTVDIEGMPAKGDAADLPTKAIKARIEDAKFAGVDPVEAAPKPDSAPDENEALGHSVFAATFADRHAARYAYDHRRGWLEFTAGRGWKTLDIPPYDAMAALVRELCAATQEDEKSVRNAIRTWDRKAMHDGALAMAAERMQQSGWNADPYLLGLPDGTYVDLRTGARHVNDGTVLISLATAVVPSQSGADFGAYVRQMLDGEDGEHVRTDWLQWTMTRALSGMQQDLIGVMIGKPGAGKSTIMGAILRAVGDYGHAIPAENMMIGKHDRHLQWKAQLLGKRIVMAAEAPDRAKWNAPMLSELTGSDPITANFMRRNSFTFFPELDMFLTCNNEPDLPDRKAGLVRRMKLVNFPLPMLEAADPAVREHWHSAAGQAVVLAWLLERCAEVFADDAERPPLHPDDKRRTDEYLKPPVDTVKDWLKNDPPVRDEARVLQIGAAFNRYTDYRTGLFLRLEAEARTKASEAVEPAGGGEFKPPDLEHIGKDAFKTRLSSLLNVTTTRKWDPVEGKMINGWSGFRLPTPIGNVKFSTGPSLRH